MYVYVLLKRDKIIFVLMKLLLNVVYQSKVTESRNIWYKASYYSI